MSRSLFVTVYFQLYCKVLFLVSFVMLNKQLLNIMYSLQQLNLILLHIFGIGTGYVRYFLCDSKHVTVKNI